jgi:hypothetical protein
MAKGRPGRTPKEDQPVKQTGKKLKDPKFGNLPGPGPGRPKGSRNKFSGQLKALVLEALANAIEGGDAVDYLISQARQPNPSPFMSLLGKCVTRSSEGDAKADCTFTWGPITGKRGHWLMTALLPARRLTSPPKGMWRRTRRCDQHLRLRRSLPSRP